MNLKTIMESKGLSQYRLSEISGLSQGHISMLVSNQKQPTLPTLQKLAAALEVSMAELVGESDGHVA